MPNDQKKQYNIWPLEKGGIVSKEILKTILENDLQPPLVELIKEEKEREEKKLVELAEETADHFWCAAVQHCNELEFGSHTNAKSFEEEWKAYKKMKGWNDE